MGSSPSERATEVVKARRESYGNPNLHYAIVAEFWNTWLSAGPGADEVLRPIEPQDVAMMMVLFKVGRESSRHNDDNLTDICGWTNVFDAMRQEVDIRG